MKSLTFTIILLMIIAAFSLSLLSGKNEPVISDQASSVLSSHTEKFPVTINQPSGPPKIKTDLADYHGNSIGISCTTCHATRTPNIKNNSSNDLDEFHQNLNFNHGELSCLSCHNSKNYNTLKKADGNKIDYENVMALCAQCHGPQYRDYLKGSHGGMTGHWDLTKGPRQRNNCIDCHDAHAPEYPKINPVFPPNDRGRQKKDYHHE